MKDLYVIKRNGSEERFDAYKIKIRIGHLAYGLNQIVDVDKVAQKVCDGFSNGMTTSELDELTSNECQAHCYEHPDYGILASRIAISDLHKNTPKTFSEFISVAYNIKIRKNGKVIKANLIDDDIYTWIMENTDRLNSSIVNNRDNYLTYFAFKTLQKTYLYKDNITKKTIERPQYNIMRTAIGIHFKKGGSTNIDDILETYKLMSKGFFTHATPTKLNACSPRAQLASCFLLWMQEDSIDGIMDTLKQCAKISKYAGGLGLAIHNIRATGSYIAGTNGVSNGIVPMLKSFEKIVEYIDQGGGKRKGSLAIYLEPWHMDIQKFLDMKLERGAEESRARNLFYALWTPDLFMKRVQAGDKWTLFSPDEVEGLWDLYGDEFEEQYIKYESDLHITKKVVNAQDIWKQVCQAQIETGTPYILFKDSVNKKNNQANLGTIKSSNLCVAPETNILTRDGYQIISTLKDKEVEVWNGSEWSKTVVRQTSESSKLITIEFSYSIKLTCTPYHRFHIIKDGLKKEVSASELSIGDQITPFILPESVVAYKYNVTNIIDEGREDATYCFNEPLRNKGVFNRILTGQCVEIMEYTSKDEVAVCNLASIALPRFIKDIDDKKSFDYELLHKTTQVVTNNLNNVIDNSYYPIVEAERSNLRHRPIGIGVQGLADVFFSLKLAYDSPEARQINRNIFETIYHGALTMSHKLAMRDGSYGSFEGSPISQGKFQFDLWLEHNMNKFSSILEERVQNNNLHSGLWDWDTLRTDVVKGVRNSLLVAPMPTASTAQIMGNTEGFEPLTSNIYSRSVNSGSFTVVNKYLIDDLIHINKWDRKTYNTIVKDDGSVKNLDIPQELKSVYKTVWEIPQRSIIDMAADRAIYIDQSQSMNLYMSDPNYTKLTSMLFHSWNMGLKSGIYYLRSRAATEAIKITLDEDKDDDEVFQCPLDPNERAMCEACQ